MKKPLLSLMVAGALAAMAAGASAQTNLAIYGIVDAGIVWDKNVTSADKTWRLESGQHSGSRLGFRGTEDLGGGLTASFTLENGFNVDTGTLGQGGRIFGRQAWVGLNGGFGSVKLGRQQTPVYNALLAVDPFAINLAGNAQRLFGGGLYFSDPFLRTDNTISYATPNIAGFTGTLGYGFGEVAGDRSLQRQLVAGASYVNGPVNVQLAYHDANTATLPAASPFLGTGIADLKTAFLGGTFDFGIAKAHLAFAKTDVDQAGGTLNQHSWLVGASAKAGSGTVLASFIRNDVRDIAAGQSDQVALGYIQPLSKRTNIYTSLSYTDNDPAVRVNAFANGERGRLFNVGVRHQF
ncbi:porin [Noviherbaspirillum denitrificans]|nr:porin [Noviherbaspirillum denitrificans]